MFNVNLEKELISSKKASLTNDEMAVLVEAEKILNNSTEEDLSILKKMGASHSIEKSKRLETKIKFIKAFDKTSSDFGDMRKEMNKAQAAGNDEKVKQLQIKMLQNARQMNRKYEVTQKWSGG